MRALITGGTGHIGKATTQCLLQNGWEVRVIDLPSNAKIEGAEYIQCNILDYDNLLTATRGCDTVIHLAAIRNPYSALGHAVFQVNVTGTFNVFEAAAAAGIRRIVQASSINALGAFYGTVEINPQYLPIDEQHPTFTTDPYSFSKQMIEDIGAYYWRREGISSVALRFPGVYSREDTESDAYIQRQRAIGSLLDELISQPEDIRQARIAEVKRCGIEFRHQRPFEFRQGQPQEMMGSIFDDPLFRTYVADRFNFWAYIDARDAAQALKKSLTTDFEGAHVLFANAACNSLGYDSRTLIRLFFPEVEHFKSDLSGASTLISIQRARNLIDFEPEHTADQLSSVDKHDLF